MYIGFAIAAFAIKYSMLYSLPEKAEIIEKKQSSIFSVIVDMKLFVAVKRSAKKLEGTWCNALSNVLKLDYEHTS